MGFDTIEINLVQQLLLEQIQTNQKSLVDVEVRQWTDLRKGYP